MKLSRVTRATVALSGAMVICSQWVSADAPPGPYFNGFETDTASWFNLSGATLTRVASGSSSTYANGASASSGNFYARLGKDSSPDSCTFGGGTAPIYYGPYTKWGGYSALFPPGGYSTGVDIYLDANFARTHPDTRFDWDSAINDTSGNFRRDFVFNVGTDALGFVISAGNNSTRCGANPADPGHVPVHVTQSGWYTFKHTFSGVSGGPLTVIFTVTQTGSDVPQGVWTLTSPTDLIDVTVGGNRYGWFVQNEFDGLAIDNSFRTGAMSTPLCEVMISDGGSILAQNSDLGTFGGNAKVSSSGAASGQQQYHDHGPIQPLTMNATTVQAVTCSDDRTQTSILGTATIDGSGTHEYRIDLKDAGEPGVNDTYRILLPSVIYDSGTQRLTGGNIQIK